MTLSLVQNKIETIRTKLELLTTELNNIDRAVHEVESPDDSAILAGLFSQKVAEFEKLQIQFAKVLEEYNEISRKENNTISFTAKKLLKAIN